MCTVCGCGEGEVQIEGKGKAHGHHHHGDGHHHHDHGHDHDHGHHHHHGDDGALDYGAGEAGAAVPGMSQSRMIQLEHDILSKNNAYAAENRTFFADHGILALNLVSSPGSGKTSLLVKTIEMLGEG